jgi:hypothetical protein
MALDPSSQVIGIVENVRQAHLELMRQTMYFPFAQLRSLAKKPSAGRLAGMDR